MNRLLKKAAWETTWLLKQARLLGHGKCYRTLAKSPFREVVGKLKQANPLSGELQSEYQGWLYQLKQLKDFLAVKMYMKQRILMQGARRFSNLDLALVLLDLLAEKDCGLVARAIVGSDTIFAAIVLPLEFAAEWSIEDERQLSHEVRRQERKLLFAELGGTAVLAGIGYCLFKQKKKKPGAK